MNFAIRTFINDKNKSDASFATVSSRSDGNSHNYALTVSFGYGSVTVHNGSKDHSTAKTLFLNKITKVRDALRNSLDADRSVPRCVRVWLNGDSAEDREYTGNVCWTVDEQNWIVSISDCQRSIRIHLFTDDRPSELSIKYCAEQRNKIENLVKFIDQAIKLINNK